MTSWSGNPGVVILLYIFFPIFSSQGPWDCRLGGKSADKMMSWRHTDRLEMIFLSCDIHLMLVFNPTMCLKVILNIYICIFYPCPFDWSSSFYKPYFKYTHLCKVMMFPLKHDWSSFSQLTREVKSWNGSQRHLPTIGFSTYEPFVFHRFPYCLASPFHFVLSFMDPHPIRCGFRCAADKDRERVRVKLLWPHLFISSRLWLKTLAVVTSKPALFSFDQLQSMTLESESTCSNVLPGLRRDGRVCQQVTGNTWAGKASSQN